MLSRRKYKKFKLNISYGLGDLLILAHCLLALFCRLNVLFVCLFFFAYFAGKFHKVLFLAPGGKTVFQGTVPEAENYFERLGFEKPAKVNPADFYMDVIGGMCESKQSRITSLPEQWDQYASENNAGAGSVENAAGGPGSPVSRQADVTLELSFNGSADVLIKDNQGIMQ